MLDLLSRVLYRLVLVFIEPALDIVPLSVQKVQDAFDYVLFVEHLVMLVQFSLFFAILELVGVS